MRETGRMTEEKILEKLESGMSRFNALEDMIPNEIKELKEIREALREGYPPDSYKTKRYNSPPRNPFSSNPFAFLPPYDEEGGENPFSKKEIDRYEDRGGVFSKNRAERSFKERI